jgi:hypothetical protein
MPTVEYPASGSEGFDVDAEVVEVVGVSGEDGFVDGVVHRVGGVVGREAGDGAGMGAAG